MLGITKCLLSLASFAVLLTASSLLSSTDANAYVAPTIPTTQTLSVVSPDGSKNFSVADGSNNKWYDRALNEDTLGTCAYKSDLSYNVANPTTYRAVSQIVYGEASSKRVLIDGYTGGSSRQVLVWFNNFDDSQQAFLSPDENSSWLQPDAIGSRPYWGMLSINNSGEYRFDCGRYNNSGGEGYQSTVSSWSFFIAGKVTNGTELVGRIFYSTFTTNYAYAGGNLPESEVPIDPPEEIPEIDETPDIYMSAMVNFKGEFSDRKFFTFDGTPFLCGEFVPQINIEIFSRNGTEELLDTLSTSASSQFTYTFPTSPQTRDYRIVSYYSCPELTINGVGFYDFQINSSGGLVQPIPCNAELFCSLNLPTYGLTTAILSPLAFVAQLPTNTCTPLVLPMPHGMTNITLPCMTPIYQQYFGPILLLFQTIMTGLFAYYVSLRTFGSIKSLTNPRDDQVETVKL